MKSIISALIAASFLGLTLPSHAQIVVSYVGTTTGSTMPGSPTDFIFFNNSNYPGYGSGQSYNINNGTTTSQLYSFSVSGGVNGYDGGSGYATITTPAGTPVLTGDLQAHPGIAFALEPGLGANSDFGTEDTNLNPSFNYNDFNVYVMISNTGGAPSDATVSLDPREFNGPENPTFGSNGVAVTDNSTDSTHALFLEFNVTGLGTAIADGYSPDLVLSANLGTANTGYIGAVSFESIAVPEPSTWAMMLGGLGLLVLVTRRRTARV